MVVHNPGHLVGLEKKVNAIRVNSNDIYSLMMRESEYQCSLYQRQITTSLFPKHPRKRSISVLFLFSFFRLRSIALINRTSLGYACHETRVICAVILITVSMKINHMQLCTVPMTRSGRNKRHERVLKRQKMKQMKCGYVFMH